MNKQPLFDPLAPLGKYRPLAWALLALAVIGFQGLRFLGSLEGNLKDCKDFFQDWAAVKFVRDGISPYNQLRLAVDTYFKFPTGNQELGESIYLYEGYNAHPPPSLFFVMPFGYLPFSQATLAWNLAGFVLYGFSMTLIWKTLELPFSFWGIFPLTILTLLGGPLVSQFLEAQWNFLFLFFLALLWRALKNQSWVEAGFWLGTVAALKLFPMLLALPWLLQKRWRAIGSCVAAFSLWNLLAGCSFGFQILTEYYFSIFPFVGGFYLSIVNVSWGGLFAKLFSPDPLNQFSPLINAPLLGKSLSLMCFILILGLWLTLVRKTKPGEEKAFLWGLFALLLAGPITWDHYFIMAIPGIIYCWKEVSSIPKLHPYLFVGLLAIMVPHGDVLIYLKNSGLLIGTGWPFFFLTFLALPLYGLTLLFALLLYMEKRKPDCPMVII